MVLQIGTASFANKYGILNQNIFDNKKEIEKIIYYCYLENIILDSSPNYGMSLSFINTLSKDFISKVSTKVVIGNDDLNIFERKLSNHLSSLDNCSIESVYFHEPKASHIEGFNNYLISAKKICNDFNVKRIGLSIYDIDDFNYSNCDYKILNCLQIPVNILDKRNVVLKDNFKNISLIARSIYLQGLLTSKGIKLLLNSSEKKDIKNASLILEIVKKFKTNIETLAIASVLNLSNIDDIIIGINSFEQLMKTISYYKEAIILSDKLSEKNHLYKNIDSDGSTFKRWLPFLSGKKNLI